MALSPNWSKCSLLCFCWLMRWTVLNFGEGIISWLTFHVEDFLGPAAQINGQPGEYAKHQLYRPSLGHRNSRLVASPRLAALQTEADPRDTSIPGHLGTPRTRTLSRSYRRRLDEAGISAEVKSPVWLLRPRLHEVPQMFTGKSRDNQAGICRLSMT